MIYQKLLRAEQRVKAKLRLNEGKLEIIEAIKEILDRVDIDAEVVSVSSGDKMRVLMQELKGENLSKEESTIIDEIFEN